MWGEYTGRMPVITIAAAAAHIYIALHTELMDKHALVCGSLANDVAPCTVSVNVL